MTNDWRVGYRKAVADFLKTQGLFVTKDAYRSYWTDEDTEDYDTSNTVYGWADHEHTQGVPWRTPPVPGCPVVSVRFETMRERSLSQFTDTFHSNEMRAGVEVRASCACGGYTDKWLRWDGAVSEILPELLKGGE
jgi:hypothetical protein